MVLSPPETPENSFSHRRGSHPFTFLSKGRRQGGLIRGSFYGTVGSRVVAHREECVSVLVQLMTHILGLARSRGYRIGLMGGRSTPWKELSGLHIFIAARRFEHACRLAASSQATTSKLRVYSELETHFSTSPTLRSIFSTFRTSRAVFGRMAVLRSKFGD